MIVNNKTLQAKRQIASPKTTSQANQETFPQESVLLGSGGAEPLLLLPDLRSSQARDPLMLSPAEKEMWRERLGDQSLQESTDKSSRVRHLQSFLNEREANKLILSGEFGEMTKRAVECAQERMGLEPTGVFTVETRETLLGSPRLQEQPLLLTPTQKNLWNRRLGSKTLKKGKNNRQNVRNLQAFLNERELENLTVDGGFGSLSEAAVKRAQKRLGLEETGVFDKKTRQTMLDAARKVPENGNGHEAVFNRVQKLLHQEHKYFGGQVVNENGRVIKRGRREFESGFDRRIGDYWASIGLGYDGDDRKVPWSAAFISWAHRSAGAGEQFKAGPAHSRYIRDSIDAKKNNRTDAAYYGHRSSERAPKVGDLVGRARQKGVDYDNQPENYKSHTDIVTEVGDGFFKMIGGNVADSCTETIVKTDSKGFIRNQKRYFVVMEPRNLHGPEKVDDGPEPGP